MFTFDLPAGILGESTPGTEKVEEEGKEKEEDDVEDDEEEDGLDCVEDRSGTMVYLKQDGGPLQQFIIK